jgi:hypothetical protein
LYISVRFYGRESGGGEENTGHVIFKWAITFMLDTIINRRQNELDATSAYVIYLRVVA